MTPSELKTAIQEARRIIAFVSLLYNNPRKHSIILSKAAAMRLTDTLPPGAITTAEWCDRDAGILFIG